MIIEHDHGYSYGAVWNAAGYEGSGSFDKDGNWTNK
jgi:hypothetical protein